VLIFKGSWRCDVNVSVSEVGSGKLGSRTEIKHIAKFSTVQDAIGIFQCVLDRKLHKDAD
jgi:Asp-tRNA(Asn)/Glu-tRNA(Gln) amidotransferase B subunit